MPRHHLSFIMAIESPEGVSVGRMIRGYAALIADGTILTLQGGHQRTAQGLIDKGFIAPDGTVISEDPNELPYL